MPTADRLLLQCEQLRDLIKEQSRLYLLDLEPSEQEHDDLITLLSTVKSGIERLPPADATEPRQQYSDLLLGLSDLDVDAGQYELAAITQEPLDLLPDLVAGSSPDSSTSLPPLKSALSGDKLDKSIKKSVRFSDKNEEFAPPQYRDVPEESNAQIFATNDQLMLDQDRRLHELGSSVHRQHTLGLDINDEVTNQSAMLDDLEAQTDRSHGRLGGARERVETFNRKAREGGSCMLILGLLLVLFILLIIL